MLDWRVGERGKQDSYLRWVDTVGPSYAGNPGEPAGRRVCFVVAVGKGRGRKRKRTCMYYVAVQCSSSAGRFAGEMYECVSVCHGVRMSQSRQGGAGRCRASLISLLIAWEGVS